jgi:hypothetical protein
MRARTLRHGALFALALAALLGLAAVANAELGQNGNIRIAFHGGIAPQKLPRAGMSPVGVLMGAKIETTDHSTPPQLKRIALEINSHGKLDSKGLPTCPLGKLNRSSASQALRACGKAQVGHGNVSSRVALPGQAPLTTNGPLLAFNGKYKGRPAIFAQVTSKGTLALTYVIVFQVKADHGTYGTKLDATLPPIASRYGYISSFDLSLKRKFSSKGQKRSFLSANCPLPKGISVSSFNFARSSFSFADGRKVSVTLSRTCRARG